MTPDPGRRVLVTGAARGIGRATAEKLAEAAAAVVVTDLARPVEGLTYGMATTDDLTATVAAIEAAGGRATHAYVDVRSHDDLAAIGSRRARAAAPVADPLDRDRELVLRSHDVPPI